MVSLWDMLGVIALGMGEVNINDALERIRSDKIKERNEGLADLKYILKQNSRSPRLDVLSDRAYHKILEALFRIAATEKASYVRASKPTARNQAASRLSACADVFRTAVEVGFHKMRHKTVKALVDHITQTLPTSDEEYCEPLVTDYLRVLRTILEYQPHPEHFSREEWQSTVDFSVQAIRDLIRGTGGNDASNGGMSSYAVSEYPSQSATPFASIGAGRGSSGYASQRISKSILKSSTEDLVLCLKYLASVPNAPVLDRAESMLTGLLDFLHSFLTPSLAHQAAFAAINSIMARISIDDMSLMQRSFRHAISLIRRFWHAKSTNLKEEMLITLLQGEHFLSMTLKDDPEDCFLADIQGLQEVLREEYCKRSEREQLQVDDLSLWTGVSLEEPNPLSISAFGLRPRATKAEQPWAILHVYTSMTVVVDAGKRSVDQKANGDDSDIPLKRRKLEQPLGDLLRSVRVSLGPEKLYDLQVLAFALDRYSVSADFLHNLLDSLLPCISEGSVTIASWAMLVITCATGQQSAHDADLESSWLQVWRIVARNITSSATCRSACYLMMIVLGKALIKYTDVGDFVDNMLSSVDLNGPVDCMDSALGLWSVLTVSISKERIGSLYDRLEKVTRWLFNRWKPAKSQDRHHNSRLAQHCGPHSIFTLLAICLGFTEKSSSPIRSISHLGSIAQAHLKSLNEAEVVRYLVLETDPKQTSFSYEVSTLLGTFEPSLSTAQISSLSAIVFDMLDIEVQSIIENAFREPMNVISITSDAAYAATGLCITGYALLSHPRVAEDRRAKSLHRSLDGLRRQLVQGVLLANRSQDLVMGLLDSIGPCLGSATQWSRDRNALVTGALVMAQAFNQRFWQQIRSQETQASSHENDVMEVDDGIESQRSHGQIKSATTTISHDAVTAGTDLFAYKNALSAKICFMSTVNCFTDADGAMIPASFVDYLTDLRPHDFLACRPFLQDLFLSGTSIANDDANTVLEYIGRELLRCYELERCEVAMGLCLDIMTGLADSWTIVDAGDVSDTGSSLYEWFIKIALSRGISSPHVYVGISSMLQRVIKVRPEYARSLSLPSARTSLFRVLEEGNIVVKFQVGKNISEIFGLFVLREHDAILEDIVDSLPSDGGWLEGIALRLFVLAHLASSWPTLLRRCVYAIFETPGQVSESAAHASFCLNHISKSLVLNSSKELFKLFAPQIIYTWLETQSFRNIPFAIFGYACLAELLRDVQDEITGQIIMRGKDEEAIQLAQDLQTPYETLLEHSFAKAAAYSIGRDVAVLTSQNNQAPSADTRLRKTLGKDRHTALMSLNFPEIVSAFYKAIDREENVDKGFQRHAASTASLARYQEIMAISASNMVLPANQQPSFKASFLVDEIERLCQRTSHQIETIWTPSLYVYTFRNLIALIQPALGLLHACSVVRKVRILVCMAGEVALTDYPLEMALHSLRPLLTDTNCAEDTIGVVQYLLQSGLPYLKSAPSFVAGMAISTLASMKAFLNTTQESTTQESQFKATMTKSNLFRLWLGTFLEGYSSPVISGPSETSFRAMIRAARNMQTFGNSLKGTAESDLLLEIMEDERSTRHLLNRQSQDLILGMLCAKFKGSTELSDSILASDREAALYAPVIERLCRRNNFGGEFQLWAARILGRAFAGTGDIDRGMLTELNRFNNYNIMPEHIATSSSSSRSLILQTLVQNLYVDNRSHTGMAEMTIQFIIARAVQREDQLELEQCLPISLIKALTWDQYVLPASQHVSQIVPSIQDAAASTYDTSASQWTQKLTIALACSASDDPLLSELLQVLCSIDGFAEQVFPFILHIVLLREIDGNQRSRQSISKACRHWFGSLDETTTPHTRILVEAILYLRKQPLPNEASKADRSRWLDVDYMKAANAAAACHMHRTALLFIEINRSEEAKASRRASDVKHDEPTDLLLQLFQAIDEPDSFYGLQQPSSLSAMMTRLEYEDAGFKSLSFRGAHYDSRIRHLKRTDGVDEEKLVRILDTLDLNGLSQSLLGNISGTLPSSINSMMRTARKLEQWDVPAPATSTSCEHIIFRAFQGVNHATDSASLQSAINLGFSAAFTSLVQGRSSEKHIHTALRTLAVLAEGDEMLSSINTEQLQEGWTNLESRNDWLTSGRFSDVETILSCRETVFSSLSRRSNLQRLTKISQRDARYFEMRNLLASSKMSRTHGALQNALGTITYMAQLVQPSIEAGVDVTAAVQYESANVLWDQGEMTASIGMLQDLETKFDTQNQAIQIGKPQLLATLGHRISDARLEKPDEIIHNYLIPAIRELRSVSEGDEAGHVFHEFASFCDQQLQNPDNLQDYHRIQKLRDRKKAEVKDLERMIGAAGSQAREKQTLKSHRDKAEQWYQLDNREFQRLQENRQAFLRQSLENYLLCLRACDKYDKDALRFSALWLEHSESDIANKAVAKHIAQIASRKFAALMNQLSSRLLDKEVSFQSLLYVLVLRICIDHPFHGMYQVFASSKSKGGKDDTSLLRNAAAQKVVNELKAHKRSSKTWLSLHNVNINYIKFAMEKVKDSQGKPGAKVALRKLVTGQRLEHDVPKENLPPPTMKIELRADCNYSRVPVVVRFQAEFTVASGISMPKILTAITSDGSRYKQLFKAGNDDLRQDSIMEQVFEQVSALLSSHRATRQRNLSIRTYKVLPLTAVAGVIEFVPNTIPLHDYLMPAHARHFPRDMKPNACRKLIGDAQPKAVELRIKAFRQVTEHFHPVLKHFFMERFESPNDWFEKRLAYTRSTAAISILGYVLGLGDRHGHNILLDEGTGEVVHIDLGIAFEQGRVLPVPEVVPFRLTRDLVDGMGITKTEGVFRRCCEFTLEALRNESYSIMTILDVLRYDPLYSWSLSPLRLKKMQDAQTEAPANGAADDVVGGGEGREEPGEADRALTVVAKKLSKTLSVTATVNELIQQATDERNLAVLFCGWAAYA